MDFSSSWIGPVIIIIMVAAFAKGGSSIFISPYTAALPLAANLLTVSACNYPLIIPTMTAGRIPSRLGTLRDYRPAASLCKAA